MKSLYRIPIDWIEEKTTGMADVVLVNSKFTGNVTYSFPSGTHKLKYVRLIFSWSVSRYIQIAANSSPSCLPFSKHRQL